MKTSVEVASVTSRAGRFNYMSPSATPSLFRNNKVLTRRDQVGSDADWIGVDLTPVEVQVHDARELSGAASPSLSRNGFEVIQQPFPDRSIDFLDNDRVVANYYGHCADVIREKTGAAIVAAFDHNVRSATGKSKQQAIKGGQQVQGPAHVVHGDYTLTSAPERLRRLAQPPSVNDTWRPLIEESQSLLDPAMVEQAVTNGRFAIINLWRSIGSEPVARNPMGLCDGQTVSPEDLVVFEIHYTDRIGENYFAKHAMNHDWFCYPAMTRDEALLITQWDSAGELSQSKGAAADASNPSSPCTFSFHSAFEDPGTPANAPDRWSIEVRCAVLYC